MELSKRSDDEVLPTLFSHLAQFVNQECMINFKKKQNFRNSNSNYTPKESKNSKKTQDPNINLIEDNKSEDSSYFVYMIDESTNDLHVDAKLNDEFDGRFLVDSGSSVSFLSEELFNKLKFKKFRRVNQSFNGFGGGKEEVKYECQLDVAIGNLIIPFM